MAKITALEIADALTGDEHLPIVQGRDTKRVTLRAFRDLITPFLQNWYKGDRGDTGPANSTYLSVAVLKAASPNNASYILATVIGPITYAYVADDFSGVQYANDFASGRKVQLTGTPLTAGALVRQSASGLTFRQEGGAIRDAEAKLQEVEKSVRDYGTGNDWGVLVDAAVARLGAVDPVRLITPPGKWTTGQRDYSDYRNITFVIRDGARIDNGAASIVLPDRVTGGGTFTGPGPLTLRNKDETPLQEPPGGYSRTGNLALGLGALKSNIGGTNNIVFGIGAASALKYARSIIAIGNFSQANLVGDPTGARARVNETEILSYFAPGDAGITIGENTLRYNEAGTECVAIGANSLQQQKRGHCNIAVGGNSQIVNQSGGYNVSLGAYCLVNNQGNNNLAIGWAALEGQTSGSNVAIGHACMNRNKTGTRNVAVSPLGFLSITTGSDNTGIGQEVGRNVTTGSNNTFGGAYAGGSVEGNSTNNTGWGANTFGNTRDVNGCTAIGSGAMNATPEGTRNSTALGIGSNVTGSNQIAVGGPDDDVYTGKAPNVRSDVRDKTDIRDTVLGLDFIRALRPKDYRLDQREAYRSTESPRFGEERPNPPRPPVAPAEGASDEQTADFYAAMLVYDGHYEIWQSDVHAYELRHARWTEAVLRPWKEANLLRNLVHDGSKKGTRFHHGLLAQDVQALIETGVIEDFGGFQDHARNGGDDVLSLGYEELIAPLIKSVQDLDRNNRTLRDELASMTARLTALEQTGHV